MKKKIKSSYSEEFKLRVVNEVLEGKYTKEEARKIYSIKSNCAILYWIRQFSGQSNYRNREVPQIHLDVKTNAMKKTKDLDKDKQILELETQLRQEKLRAGLWKKMVDIAEDELKIDIRKKCGAK